MDGVEIACKAVVISELFSLRPLRSLRERFFAFS